MDNDLVAALRLRGIDVATPGEHGMLGRSDATQLRWSTAQRRTLYSFNVGDFYDLHTHFVQRGEQHAGIILAQQRHHAVGDQMRALLKLGIARSAEDMMNRVEFLSAWIRNE